MQTNNLKNIDGKINLNNQKTNQILCACGCGQKIIIKKYHKYYGIPKYIHGHTNKNKTYEELYGINKSKKLKELRSINRKGKLHSKKSILRMSLANKGKHLSQKTEFKKGQVPWNKDKHNIYSQETINKIKKARLNQILPLKDTLPERLIQNKLKELNIKFITHQNIKNITQPDIFIEPNVCIFIDGCYWHGCEQCFDRNKFNEMQHKAIIRSILVTRKLIEQNYIVLRLWEHEIKYNINLCLLQIKNKIKEYDIIKK